MSVVELIHLAELLKQSGEAHKAAALYEEWVQTHPNDPMIYAVLFNRSALLSDLGEASGARACLERAIEINPEFRPAYVNLGRVLERAGDASGAVNTWSRMVDQLATVNGSAITYKTIALNQMARVLEYNNHDAAAEATLRHSLELDRDQPEVLQHFIALRQRQCTWPVIAPWERVGRRKLMKGMSPLSYAAYTDDPMIQLAAAWNYHRREVGTPAAPHLASPITSHWAARARPSGRLRIGYLSSDLREHAIGHLMLDMFGLHDRSAVEVFAYYCGPVGDDPMRRRFRQSADHWVPITDLDDEAAARRITDDAIQILVDVNGYTKDGRTKLVAMRPAPVIVNWLGFPGSLGTPFHHYIIADDWIIRPEDELYYSEKVLRLPCYQPNQRERIIDPATPSRRDAGLPEHGTVFCCFNGTHKITRATFERWLTILARVPGSVLWLLAATDRPSAHLRAYAAERGIAPERIIFAAKLANPQHMARYPLADLFLDTTPYGAHTTASDALWMGVPVLTLDGRSFAARVCGSLLQAAGLPDLICRSAEEYVDRAVALGLDASLTMHYRDRLLAARAECVLFDTPLLVRRLEELYRHMWSECQAGRLPRPDLSSLGAYLDVGIEQDHEAIEVRAVEDYRGWWAQNMARHNAVRPGADDRCFP